MEELKIVAISDTHCRHNELTIPKCDILIHAGDYSFRGLDREIKDFYNWLNKQPATYKISIVGNHEVGWEKDPLNAEVIALTECPDIHLLDNEEVIIEGIKIYGFPETPWFCDWAFNKARTESEAILRNIGRMKDHTDKIPLDTEILVTHGPPYEILDKCPDGRLVGCVDLRKRILDVKPDIHIFGHIHHSHGEHHENGTSFYNASICDERYLASNPITIIDYLTENK